MAYFNINGKNTDVMIRYPEGGITTAEDIAALPLGIGSKLVSLKALADVRVEDAPATIYREDQRDLFVIFGRDSKNASRFAEILVRFYEKSPRGRKWIHRRAG